MRKLRRPREGSGLAVHLVSEFVAVRISQPVLDERDRQMRIAKCVMLIPIQRPLERRGREILNAGLRIATKMGSQLDCKFRDSERIMG